MAKKDFSMAFSNCSISLENNEIVEYPRKESGEIRTYVLSEVLKELEGEQRRFNITFKESIEIDPDELG